MNGGTSKIIAKSPIPIGVSRAPIALDNPGSDYGSMSNN